ncbi:MAG: cation-translocating P-type ATPase [Desulfotomaculales bacterium]
MVRLAENTRWHTLDVETVARELGTSLTEGLTPAEAEARHRQYGPNRLPEARGVPPWLIFIRQFKSVIVLLLLAATGVSIALGDFAEAAAIAAVIILNALFGFAIELRAERAVAALKRIITCTAKVIRGGRLIEIPATSVVPGDLLVLEEGDRVAADARLVDADSLATIEAALTGESQQVEKDTRPLADGRLPLGDRTNMVYAGTSVARSSLAVVTATGRATEVGHIAGLLERTKEEKTPLEKRLGMLGNRLVFVALVIAAVVTLAGWLTGHPFLEILTTGIALAVAAVPEGLPAVATITLAIGVRRMARQNAIVRRLQAVETLGSTTVICTDKTGTLTENRMTLMAVWVDGEDIELGERWWVKPLKPALRELLEAGVLASRAGLQKDAEGNWDVVGDATEGRWYWPGCVRGSRASRPRNRDIRTWKRSPFLRRPGAWRCTTAFPTGKRPSSPKGHRP